MVLEHLFPENWLEKKSTYAFLLGGGYSIIGIILSSLLFPSDPALVAVAFTAILMLPELYKLFSIEEHMEEKEKRFSIKHLWKDENNFIRIYLFLFLGIFIIYSLAAIVLPSFQVNSLFREQLEMRAISGDATLSGEPLSTAAVGGATFTKGLFWAILINNFWVMLACFVISLLTGDGAVFLITWNASVWGTIFGVTARNAAAISGSEPFIMLGLIFLIVFPHMILESLCYILAAISGGLISKSFLTEKFGSKIFDTVMEYNVSLFVLAIIFLLLGALVETFVLDNATFYLRIIQMSLLAG
ncbi:hypothetical protein CMO92_03315 [Candidatus Woesearchaeota archaeon]|nr:hypothetical protein [Candidatus Woesearchaeota archaeon]